MPAEVQKVERTLRSIGMGSEVDKAILAMNRAAEDAAVLRGCRHPRDGLFPARLVGRSLARGPRHDAAEPPGGQGYRRRHGRVSRWPRRHRAPPRSQTFTTDIFMAVDGSRD